MTITDTQARPVPFRDRTSFSRNEISDCTFGRGEFEGYPRLPKGRMRLIDSVSYITATGGEHGQGYAEATFAIRPNLWFFEDHFDGDPVMPGWLMADGLLQLTGFFAGWLDHKGKGRARSSNGVKWLSEVVPTSRLLRSRIDVISVQKDRRSEVVIATASGVLYCDDVKACTAQELKATILPL